jgi:hypothetical protein
MDRTRTRVIFGTAGAVLFATGIGIGAVAGAPDPVTRVETETVTRTVEVEAEPTRAEEEALREEGRQDAADDLAAEREAILQQGRQEGWDAGVVEVTNQQAAAAAAAEAAARSAAVGPGTLAVGADIQPGTYRAETSGTGVFDSCYWARLSNLSGGFDAIIANNNFNGVATVEIKPGDAAFETTCAWTPVG